MRFMLIFSMPEGTWLAKDLVKRIVAWKREYGEKGIWQTGCPLKPPGMTHTLHRKSDGTLEEQDGPISDHSQIFYAFEILECSSMEEAISVAREHPGLEFEKTWLEIREIWDTLDEDIIGEEYYLAGGAPAVS